MAQSKNNYSHLLHQKSPDNHQRKNDKKRF